MRSLHRAALARINSAAPGAQPDSGFAMLYVLMVVLIITTVAGSVIAGTAGQVVPSQTSVDASRATAAAQAGIQAFVARLNNADSVNGCGKVPKGSACTALSSINYTLSATVAGADAAGTSSYYAYVANKPGSASPYTSVGFVRIYSLGCSVALTPHTGAASTCDNGVSRALVSDIMAPSSLTPLAYYSTFETVGSGLLAQEYPARTIAIPNSSILNGFSLDPTVLGTSSVTWNGATSSSATSQYCDSEWYNSSINALAAGRNSSLNSLLGYDWSETGTAATPLSIALPLSHLGQCQVALTSNNTFTGPISSKDAFYLSGTPTITESNGKVPGVKTGWLTTSSPQNNSATPYSLTAPPYNTDKTRDAITGTTSQFTFSGSDFNINNEIALDDSNLPTLPTSLAASEPIKSGTAQTSLTNPTCIYYGPTRIQLTGDGSATVTSPMTMASTSDACYTSTGSATLTMDPSSKAPIDPATGLPALASNPGRVTNARVLVAGSAPRTIIVRNVGAASTWAETTGDLSATQAGYSPIPAITTSNTNMNNIFALSSTLSTPAWTVVDPTGTNLSTFNTDATTSGVKNGLGGALGYTSWPTFKSTFLAAHTSSAMISTTLATQLNNALPDSTGGASTPTASTSWRYRAVNQLAKTSPGTATDPLLASNSSGVIDTIERQTAVQSVAAGCAAGGYYTGAVCWGTYQSCLTFICGASSLCTAALCAACTTNGTIVGALAFLGTGTKCITGTVTAALYTWPTDGSGTPIGTVTFLNQNTATFPLSTDRNIYTTYNTTATAGPGDAYIGGQLGAANSQSLSVIAENDVVVTGSITPADGTNGSTEPAAALIGGKNVRIYHPVSCNTEPTTTALTTSAGFCPNDTTGLFTYATLSKALGTNHPSQQYANLQQDQTQASTTTCLPITINGAIFALGGSTSPLSNGSFTTDSPDKGSSCGSTILNGGVYQQHRGTLGTTLEDFASTSKTGYDLKYNYDANLETKLATSWTPPTSTSAVTSQSAAPWKLVSTSTASPTGS